MGLLIVMGLCLFAVSLSMLMPEDADLDMLSDMDRAQAQEETIADASETAGSIAPTRDVPLYEVEDQPMALLDLPAQDAQEDDGLMARLEDYLARYDAEHGDGSVQVDIVSPHSEDLAQTVISDFKPGEDVLSLNVDLDYPANPLDGDDLTPLYELDEVAGDTVVRLAGFDLVVIEGVTDLPQDAGHLQIRYAA